MAYLDKAGLTYLWSKIKIAISNELARLKESGEFTPQKGVDYFTEADKEELVSEVLESLPEWQGGSY